MITAETIKLGLAKAAIEGKIKGYKMGIISLGENSYSELKTKYEAIINELEDILKIIEE